jgi:hypothetical protein
MEKEPGGDDRRSHRQPSNTPQQNYTCHWPTPAYIVSLVAYRSPDRFRPSDRLRHRLASDLLFA